MLTLPWLFTSTMRDLMRYPRHHHIQQHQHRQQQPPPPQHLQQQKQQTLQSTAASTTQNISSQVAQTNTTPLCPKPQPTPLRADQTEVQAKLEQHQHQLQQQQQQIQAQQAAATTTVAGGKQLVSSATSSPQLARRSAPGSPAVQTKRDQTKQKVTDSPRLRRAFIDPPPGGLHQLQTSKSSTQELSSAYPTFDLVPSENEPIDPNMSSDAWAQKQIDQFIFDFDRADKDKSGALSLAEVVGVLKAVGFKGTDEEAKAIFAHLDKNKDDRISRSEFKACCDKLPRMTLREYAFRKTFQKIDKDESGYLTKKELMDALEADSGVVLSAKGIGEILVYITKEDDDEKVAYDEFLRVLNFEESASVLNQIFRRLDKDGSGSLTLDEMNAAIAAEGEIQKLKPRIIKLLKYHGKDLDKKINYHEFVSAWLKTKGEK